MKAVGVMDFAGGFACGVEQSGFEYFAKREPSAFGGFGVPSIEANMPEVQVEVSEPEFWSVVKADMLFGCPPCSGFSMLSTINTASSKTGKVVDGVRVAQRGVDSPDNKWMGELVHYAAKVKPEVAVFESVPSGGKLGQPLMRELWQTLREESGLDYQFTDVFMNAALVGGDVIRPRYFWVAHLRPFGVDLPRLVPRTLMEVLEGLPLEEDDSGDLAWGHVTNGSRSTDRIRQTILELRAQGEDWLQGTRLPMNLQRFIDADDANEVPTCWRKADGTLLSHAVSDNMYAPFRWRAGRPMGVVTGGFMDRAVHPLAARTFTYREGARFMGLPDSWSLEPIVVGKKDSWLGKAIPVASGRWIGTWAGASIAGDPGDYAGVVVEPGHRVIDVTTADKVALIERDQQDAPVWWPERTGPPRKVFTLPPLGRPKRDPAQRVRVQGTIADVRRALRGRVPPPEVASRRPRIVREPRAVVPRGTIARVPPDRVRAIIEGYGLKRSQAADALGVSPSRVGEMVTDKRPNSWLAEDRLPEFETRLAEYAEKNGDSPAPVAARPGRPAPRRELK